MDGLRTQGCVVVQLVCGAAIANAAAIDCQCFLSIAQINYKITNFSWKSKGKY